MSRQRVSANRPWERVVGYWRAVRVGNVIEASGTAPAGTWEEAGRAHGDVFAEIRPANTTMWVGGLIDPDILVEIEATAVLDA